MVYLNKEDWNEKYADVMDYDYATSRIAIKVRDFFCTYMNLRRKHTKEQALSTALLQLRFIWFDEIADDEWPQEWKPVIEELLSDDNVKQMEEYV